MCKSSSLAFILFFAFLFRLEPPSIRLVLIIAVMTLGVLMMVAGEAKFSPIGFILVITAAFFSGFRWGLTQILLLRNQETSNPFSSIFFLAPVMFLGLFILAIPIEEISSLIAGLRILTETYGPITGPLLLLFPGTIAFCMTASEFALLKRTSVVTLSIAGIFKEIVTITSAGLVLKDKLTPINICGLVVTMIAIISYNLIKIQKIHQTSQEETHKKLSLNTESTKTDYITGTEDSDDP
ncbi:putative transporter C22E12.01 [Golovinomyces cichoracearum]|uniref:Putative transporter C22E12.01 n=1 Tax=Golovinomyces cichoracearum TaxID=62708 RepID=A0A420J0P3_9PEZI|nr:putative transporter C22E12.01 [Golovinomyces cichoracearum]